MLKVTLLIALATACVSAQVSPQFAPPGEPAGVAEPYSYAYETETHAAAEQRDPSGKVSGYYTLAGPDGRQRRVEYVADEAGFRAKVQTNEVGTKSDSSADVVVQADQPTPEQLAQGSSGVVGAAPPQGPAGPQVFKQQTSSRQVTGQTSAGYAYGSSPVYGYGGGYGYGYYPGVYGYGPGYVSGYGYGPGYSYGAGYGYRSGYGVANNGVYGGYGANNYGTYSGYNNHSPSSYYKATSVTSGSAAPVQYSTGTVNGRYVSTGNTAGNTVGTTYRSASYSSSTGAVPSGSAYQYSSGVVPVGSGYQYSSGAVPTGGAYQYSSGVVPAGSGYGASNVGSSNYVVLKKRGAPATAENKTAA